MAVRFGLLSTARINQAILTATAASEAVEVVAVGSRDQARAEIYARDHGIERAHGSYEELLADPDVEIVYVSLPNSLHVEWTIRALEAGKHVLCEKPFGRRASEVERAFDVAERAGLVLMEAFMWRHHPQTEALGQVIRSGRLGQVRLVRARFSFTLEDQADVRMTPELDGGALMDLGCYCVNGLRFVAGEPELVSGRQVLGPSGVDVRFAGTLEFPGAVLAQLDCGFDLPRAAGLEVVGSEGVATVADPWLCSDPHVDVDGQRIDVQEADRYRVQLENMSAAVRGEAEPLLGRDDAVGQARTIEALYRSAATGSAVRP